MRTTLLLLALLVPSFVARAEDREQLPCGRWPNGFAYSVVASEDGRYAYASSGGAVLVCPLADPKQVGPGSHALAVPVSEIPTAGFVFSLATQGSDLFVAGSRGGFFHVDVTDKRNPGPATKIGASNDIAFDVAVRGDLVAFADGGGGIALFRRGKDGCHELSRTKIEKGRAMGVALGDGFVIVAGGDGDVLRFDLSDPAHPLLAAKQPSTGVARSVALTSDGRFALFAEDLGDLTIRDARSLGVVKRQKFVLPANKNPGPQRSPKPETPLAVGRIRVLDDRGYVGLEGTAIASQQSPFTPEFGAWRGEPHYDPRSATAVFQIGALETGTPAVTILGFADELSSHAPSNVMNWIKDVAPLPHCEGGDFLALDFTFGAVRMRPSKDKPRRDGLPGLQELGLEIDTRAGAIDCAFSPTDPKIVYAISDIGGLQILDVSDKTHPRLLHRVPESGGTFCAVTRRLEKAQPDGFLRSFDYVFVNNFFRVGIVKIDPTNPTGAQSLTPLWITVPDAVRGKKEFESLGLTPRSYRVTIDGDNLDVVSTNTVFGWQRFSIAQVLACKARANIYEGIERPAEYALKCPPLWRAITSPDNAQDATGIRTARSGKVMGIHADESFVILGSGAQRDPAGGRGGGGRGGAAPAQPFDGYLQYFDLADPVVEDATFGPLRFPRGTRFVPNGEIQIGLAMRGNELFVADTAGILRVFDFDSRPKDKGLHGENHFLVRDVTFENVGVYGRDSLFDAVIDGDRLHLAGWSAGYICLSIAKDDPANFLKPLFHFDSPGLPISIAIGPDRSVVVAEHNAGVLVFPAVQP